MEDIKIHEISINQISREDASTRGGGLCGLGCTAGGICGLGCKD